MIKKFAVLLGLAVAACASGPAQAFDCSPFAGRGNFVRACEGLNIADSAIVNAQQANGFRLAGHAANARSALQQAYGELLAGAASR